MNQQIVYYMIEEHEELGEVCMYDFVCFMVNRSIPERPRFFQHWF